MKKKTWKIIVRHLVLALLAIIWLIPIVWLVVTSLSTTKGVSYQHFFPEHWTHWQTIINCSSRQIQQRTFRHGLKIPLS